MPSSFSLLGLLALLAGPGDPRIPLVEEQLKGREEAALAATSALIENDPRTAERLWLRYLEADLLERQGRLMHANTAFARLLSAEPELAAWARLRMARLQEAMGHPEVSAGLLANLLGRGAPELLQARATDLLVRALDRGADCRLLGRLDAWPVGEAQRRALDLSLAECALAAGDAARAVPRLVDLLERETADLIGRRAADHLARLDHPLATTPETRIAIGLAFHHNREFDRAIVHLEAGLSALDPEHLSLRPEAVAEYRYATARAYFWLRDYDAAASRFHEIAVTTDRDEAAARAYYQEARCHELSGAWREASAAFRRAFAAESNGDWAAAALFSALRVEFRSGHEVPALELFRVLESRSGWSDVARRAALFLVASDLERGRADRAALWLRRHPGEEAVEEFLYWGGRLAELDGSPHLAIREYVRLLRRDAHHPLAAAARVRLSRPPLAELRESVGQQLAASGAPGDLHAAWILLGDESAGGRAARERLAGGLSRDRRSRVFLDLAEVPTADWPLWSSPLDRPGERLLALGLWSEGEAYVRRHFPLDRPPLAFSAAAAMERAGMTRSALYVVEVLARAIPDYLPESLLPVDFRRLLHPYPYRSTIEREALRQGVDPTLLAGLIREESRFDPDAVSVASARGLTQFVFPTALEVAPRVGLEIDDPVDLHVPEVAIRLGAAYLGGLQRAFDGRVEHAVTAYNAGEDQTRVWRSYCYSRNPAEYYSKVGFAQTRSYLRKVLASRSRYRALYGADGTPDVPAP